MTFVSFSFLIFITLTVFVYFITPGRWQWVVLLLASLCFFWLNSRWLVVFLAAAALTAFLTGLWLSNIDRTSKKLLKEKDWSSKEDKKKYRESVKRRKKVLLFCAILVVLGMLLVLKYYRFFASTANQGLRLLGFELPSFKFLMPLGISFYTLQAIAYMVDVYRGKEEADRNFFKFLLFMSFFPQIVQGPIARHHQLAEQLYASHRFSYRRCTFGLQLILWGWMKKMIIADRVLIPVTQIFDSGERYTGLLLFLGAVLYSLQVYADFSGGMDMARGVSQILGIELEENFRQPYFADSVENFWRRWHITLGSWMRDYVFYPLTLSGPFVAISKKTRKIFGSFVGKRLPALLASFIVYALVGLWHGPEWKYIAYGLWNGLIIAAGILLPEIYAGMKKLAGIDGTPFSWKLFMILRTFTLISLGRVFSRSGSVMTALHTFKNMTVQWWDLSFLVDGRLNGLGLDTPNWVLLAIAVCVLLIMDLLHEKGIRIREGIARQPLIFRWIVYIGAILVLLVFGIYGAEYNSASFIYEQF